jgi:tetratricopeptide (TPR) repeat protein
VKSWIVALGCIVAGCSVMRPAADAPDAAAMEARALDGRALLRPPLPDDVRAKYEAALAEAQADYAREPSADHLIWVGRRLGYLGRYREAIARFSEGIDEYPRDARFRRHRGHRYLTTRQLARAVADFEAAAKLIAGTPDQVEPDGLPNARGIPTSTLHTNIHYHLGLAHYLRGDNAAARTVWLACLAAARNPDMEAATRYWLYLAQRRLGLENEAAANLAAVDAGWDIIENRAYHALLLRFRGDVAGAASAAPVPVESLDDATFAYGLAQWHRFAGRDAEADTVLERLLAGPQWAAFGYLAAEADRARARR